MADEPKRGSTKDLVGAVLSQVGGEPTAAAEGEGPSDAGKPKLGAADLAKSIVAAQTSAEAGETVAAKEAASDVAPPAAMAAGEQPVLPAAEPGAAPGLPTQSGAPQVTAQIAESIMAKLGPPAGAAESDSDPAPEDLGVGATEEDAAALIEVYFDLETPEERDGLLRRLMEMKLEVVTEFLRTMMQEDEDDYLRAEAAAELARRRDPEGLAAIENDFEDPEEPFFFENAMKTLCEINGAGFYETLRTIWLDPESDGDKRRDVMLGMEDLDLERALTDFRWLVESTTDIDLMLDDQIEVAMMAFVRHDHREAVPALEGLRDRIAAADVDPDEGEELGQFIQEGIDLLQGSAADDEP